MNIRITVMCWIKGKEEAHEIVDLDEEQLLDVLRGCVHSVFKTPPEQQRHWELRTVTFD